MNAVVATVSSLVPNTPSTPEVVAVSTNAAPSESSGSTYQGVLMLPLARPSRSPAPPSITYQGSCPAPLSSSLAWSTSNINVAPGAKPLAVMRAMLPGA